jgi:hypothetical protein
VTIFFLLLLTLLTVGCWYGYRYLDGKMSELPHLPRRGHVTPRKATRVIYFCVDEILGIRARLIDERAKRHQRISFWVSPRWASLVSPRSWAGVPAPNMRKMRTFVRQVSDIRPVRNWRDLGATEGAEVPHKITLHYTSEAATNVGRFIEDLERGRRNRGGGLAQALGLEWHEGMFSYGWNRSRRLIFVTLREELPMPATANGDGGPPTVAMPDYPTGPFIWGNGSPKNPARRGDVTS